MANLNLHGNDSKWRWGNRPSSPAESSESSSTASRSSTPKLAWSNASTTSLATPITPATSHSDDFESRTSTPTASRSSTPIAPVPTRPMRPIFSVPNGSSSTLSGSHASSSSISGSPPGRFFASSSPKYHHEHSIPHAPPTPNPFQNRDARKSSADIPSRGTPRDIPQITVTIITPTIIQEMTKLIPSILMQLRWHPQSRRLAYVWTIQNPKTALLLWMCDDMEAWRQAAFFDLHDGQLPFTEDMLYNIAKDPDKVLATQWRVMCKDLPRNGGHVEYQTGEPLPLHSLGPLYGECSSDLRHSHRQIQKTLDRVRWLSDNSPQTDRVYVRKKLILPPSQSSQRKTILAQISKFRNVHHTNLDKIFCSYAQNDVIGFVTESAQYDLEEYLRFSSSTMTVSGSHPWVADLAAEALQRQNRLLGWINDLAQALAFLHDKNISHRSIRPRKILISSNRIYFSVFGVGDNPYVAAAWSRPNGINGTVAESDRQAQHDSETYIYAAPEIIRSHESGAGFSSSRVDSFSLGCVFLSILTAVRGYDQADFAVYRATETRDYSFHANLSRVAQWIRHLRNSRSNASSGSQTPTANGVTAVERGFKSLHSGIIQIKGIAESSQSQPIMIGAANLDADVTEALALVKRMMSPEPSKRDKMKRSAAAFAEWNIERQRRRERRRNSISNVVGDGKRWKELAELEAYYRRG
ncbi:kinase-like protein [Eremomyces bilateralis CBS 781.70]|uniref:Kinase-like protein n=1 Tax=Eremomyces bilateralis CBS 781.70 TaxID=1392243 RepID=A0A6G1G1U6_9PEZI|nr:kinase-like protein [Eremomyces bilateralis CBS 781.70]KAF1811779.1 kinase-like protein [Eremomyces bilateralis CBS 781.70]